MLDGGVLQDENGKLDRLTPSIWMELVQLEEHNVWRLEAYQSSVPLVATRQQTGWHCFYHWAVMELLSVVQHFLSWTHRSRSLVPFHFQAFYAGFLRSEEATWNEVCDGAS
jgi:hypothetical protein